MNIEIFNARTFEAVGMCYRRWYDIATIITENDISRLTAEHSRMIDRANIILNGKISEPRIGIDVIMDEENKYIDAIHMWVNACEEKP